MSFEVGNPGGPGRPPGLPNKTTMMVRNLFATILEDEQENFKAALEQLRVESPKDYVQVMTKLSAKFLPDLTVTALQNADGTNLEPMQIIIPQQPPRDE